MRILYIHGFGSQFDPNHEKIKVLETLGTVVGVNVDYCRGFENVCAVVKDAILESNIDLVVGTSMGGYTAACVGTKMGIPFVSLNPAVTPSVSLQRWVGNFTDYAGNDHVLTESMVATYPDIPTDGYGLILLQSGDEVIPAGVTQIMLDDFYRVVLYPGGTHRFENLEKALPDITTFVSQANACYGLV